MIEAEVEYCLFHGDVWWLCLTVSEWASWVQAIGTVAAVFAAVLLAWGTSRSAHKQARAAIGGFAAQVHFGTMRLEKAAVEQRGDDYLANIAQLRDLMRAAESTRLDLLPMAWIRPYLQLREAVALAIDKCDRAGQVDNFGYWLVVARDARSEVVELVQQLPLK